MADRLLLGERELGEGALVVAAGLVGDEDGVVAEAAAAAALAQQRALAAGFEEVLVAALVDEGDRADVGGAAVAVGGRDFAQQLRQVLLVAGAFAGVAGGVDPGGAAEVGGFDPRVVGDRRPAGRGMAGAGLDQRVGLEAVARLRRQLDLVGQRLELRPRQQIRHLPQLVLVAGGEDERLLRRRSATRHEATRSCTSRRRPMPSSARLSSSSSEARESGVRSAVACTSTRPPSPVITTLASTSARESSP